MGAVRKPMGQMPPSVSRVPRWLGRERRGLEASLQEPTNGADSDPDSVPNLVQAARLLRCVAPPTVGLGHLRFRQLMETNMDRVIRFDYTVTSKMICDLMTTFIESGGMISWPTKVQFYTWDTEGNKTKVSYHDTWKEGSTFYDGRWSLEITDEEGTHMLGWKKLKWALERPERKKDTADFLDENYDVETADNLVQTAIFREIVYG